MTEYFYCVYPALKKVFCERQYTTENRKIGYNFSPDDFCSYGKRKDCGGNG